MKRVPFVISLALVLILAACSSAPIKDAYTASGDGNKPSDLTPTKTFKYDDDLNVVITLNSHNRDLPLYAVFNAPNGQTYPTDPLDANDTVGKVVLGLDWESQNNTGWESGAWQVDIYVDNAKDKTLDFTVEPSPGTAPAG